MRLDVLAAMIEADGNADRAVELCPWLGEPEWFPSGHYRRRIDAPRYRSVLVEVRGFGDRYREAQEFESACSDLAPIEYRGGTGEAKKRAASRRRERRA